MIVLPAEEFSTTPDRLPFQAGVTISSRWFHLWHNEFGGYGEIQWTSQEVVNGVKVLYGFVHECKQESDDPTDHIIMCEMFDKDNFKYTIRSFRKGILEIVASRIRTQQGAECIIGKTGKRNSKFSRIM